MNKKILAAAIAALLVTPMAFADYDNNPLANTGTDDDAVDLQNITITVPEVALINVDTGPVDVSDGNLAAPTVAGQGFTGTATKSTAYDISSNVANVTNPNKREITVNVSGTTQVPEGALLKVEVVAPTGGTTGTAELTNTTTSDSSATGIGNIAESDLAIKYTLGVDPAANLGDMIAFTGTNGTQDTVELTYTLTDD